MCAAVLLSLPVLEPVSRVVSQAELLHQLDPPLPVLPGVLATVRHAGVRVAGGGGFFTKLYTAVEAKSDK